MTEVSTQNITSEEKESCEESIKESVVVPKFAYKVHYSFTSCHSCKRVHNPDNEYTKYICQHCGFDHEPIQMEMQNNVDRIVNENIDLNYILEEIIALREENKKLDKEWYEATKQIETYMSLDEDINEYKDIN